MKEIWAWIQAALVAVGGFLGWFVGGFDGLLYALIALMAADYVTGVMCAIADRTLSSAVGFRGIAKKVLIFVLVGWAYCGHLSDRQWQRAAHCGTLFLLLQRGRIDARKRGASRPADPAEAQGCARTATLEGRR